MFADMLYFWFYWLELRLTINRLIDWIDWLIDQRIDRLIDRLVVCRLVVGFVLFRALRPWALWPLGVSVGPSWVCRADFSNGKVQNSVLFRPAWGWLKNTPSRAIGETHRKSSFAKPFDHVVYDHLWPQCRPFRTMAAYSVPRAKCPLQAVCAVRLARAQTVTCRILETEIHVESVALLSECVVLGMS